MQLDRVKQTIDKLNQYGASDIGINRLAYTQEEQQARRLIESLCVEEGMTVRVDSCGNMIARREGKNANLPVVACGSHLDTVYQGGKYDGVTGVVGALEAIRMLNEKNIQTLHPIELIVFACEESSRFGVATIGSKAMAGSLDIKSISSLKDKKGISIQQAFSDCDLNFDEALKAARKKDEFKVFLELHIEQGSFLEAYKLQIGIVAGIAAPTRIKVEIQGVAAHSGSTPMSCRKDALLGASEMALRLEQAVKKESDYGTVGTVGVLDIKPGAINVIPGSADMMIDIRGINVDSKKRVLNDLIKYMDHVKINRGLKIKWEMLSDDNPVLMDEGVQKELRAICDESGIRYTRVNSGAGHDVMNMAKLCPTGLIFVPSAQGLSHNPDEYTSIEDIERGILILNKALMKFASPCK